MMQAVIPDGYMPASAGSGLLVTLCPDALPPGVELAHTGHHHAGHGNDAGDRCDIGHFLSGIAFPTQSTIAVLPLYPPQLYPVAVRHIAPVRRTPTSQPRAPPVS